MTGNLHEKLFTFMIVPRLIFVECEILQTKVVENITFYVQYFFFFRK